MRFYPINFILYIILFSLSSCVGDSTGTESKSTVASQRTGRQTDNTNETSSQSITKVDETSKTSMPKVNPIAKKTKPSPTKRDGMVIDPVAKQKVLDDAKEQLAQLEANKSNISAAEYNRKKSSMQDVIANPEKFTPRKRLTPKEQSVLPDACELVSDAFIAKTIGVDVAFINIKDGTNASSQHAKACFFRWDHNNVPNSGVLIQVQENPLPEEIDDWAAYYIQAKIHQGETNPNTMESTKFKPYNDLGIAGAYNYELHRYLWRTEEGIVFMIALNLRGTESQELSWVKILGEEVMKNYRSS